MNPNTLSSFSRISLLFFLAIIMHGISSAAVNTTALKSDSLANVFINDGKYEDAIKMLNRTVSALDENHPDSLYIQSFVKMGYCYDRLENQMKAIEMTKMAIFLHQGAGMPENLYLANLYDNIALAYYKLEQYNTAEEWITRSLGITTRSAKAIDAQIRQYQHASMIKKALDKLPESIENQKTVVDLVEKKSGKYAESHIENLSILRTLYKAIGDSASYNATSSEIRQLRDEIAEGVLPQTTDLSTPKLCRQHNQDALLCCRWILGNYVNTPGMKSAVDFLTQFYRHTPDVAIYVGKAEESWIKKLNSVYFMAYIAASCDYALRHQDDLRYSVLQYKYAMNKVLDYYKENTKITGTIPTFDSYLRQREHTPEKFDKVLSKNFKTYCDQMKSKRPHEFDIEAPTIMTFSY